MFVIVKTNDAPGDPVIVISLNAPFVGIRDLSISNPVIKLTSTGTASTSVEKIKSSSEISKAGKVHSTLALTDVNKSSV